MSIVLKVYSKDPLKFWKKNHDTFPLTSSIAREALAIAATNCNAERSFSSFAYLLAGRESMTSQRLSNLLCCHSEFLLNSS